MPLKCAPVVGGYSPWGEIDGVSELAHGVWSVSTPGHGGIKLSPSRNRHVHWIWRQYGGWYEEDVNWAIAAATFWGFGDDEMGKTAYETVSGHFPYECLLALGDGSAPGNVRFLPGDPVTWLPKVGSKHLIASDLHRVFSSFDPAFGKKADEEFEHDETGSEGRACIVVQNFVYVSHADALCTVVLHNARLRAVSRTYLSKLVNKPASLL